MAAKGAKKNEGKTAEKKLTDRQETFCKEYIIDYNATQAAIRAGYSKKTARSVGSENLTKPDILARVRALQKECAEKMCITPDWVIMQLVEVYNRCMTAVPVLEWDPDERKKVHKGEYVFDSKGALEALEKIGRHLGLFEAKENKAPPKIEFKLPKECEGFDA